jgi:valyl-tRNA synthetase
MPFKTGELAGKLTRKELIDKYADNFEKMGKFWTRQQIVEKLQAKGVVVEGEVPLIEEQPVEVVEEAVEVVEEVPVEEVVEESKPAPKKRGRPKKQK